MRFPVPPRRLFVVLALVASAARPSFADEPKDSKEAKEAEKPPAQVAAEKGSFTVVLELDGTLDALDAKPIEVHADVFGGELEAKSAPILVPTVVKAGDLLVAFDPEKLDDQIAGAKHELEIAKIAFERSKEEAKRDEAESARTLARTKLEQDRAVEALEYFNRIERARRVTESALDLKSTTDSVADQVEELDQLKKMYKADDVVEETEAIVMRRTERALERTRKFLAIRQEGHDRLIAVELPRELEDRQHAAAKATSEYEKSVATVPMDLEKARRELAKTTLDLALSTKNLAKLEKDRTLFEVRAPAAGLVVPGTLTEGKWSGGEDIVKALRTKEGLKPHQVLFTLLPGASLVVRTSVPEASILDVAAGQTAEVKLAALPARALSAKVFLIGLTPEDGKFDVVLDLAEKDARFMAGFACKLKLSTVTKADAITVPEDSVVTKGDKHQVFVWAAPTDGKSEGKSIGRDVEVGATSAGRTEILKGLDAGTKVLESPPK